MNFPTHVRIVEMGPRDGLQNEKQIVSTETKVELIARLGRPGPSYVSGDGEAVTLVGDLLEGYTEDRATLEGEWRHIEQAIAGMTEVEGFESMTGDAAFLPGLKDYYTNKLTQNIALGNDVATELANFDNEWAIAKEGMN